MITSVDEGTLTAPNNIYDIYRYLIKRVPDPTPATKDFNIGTIFSASEESSYPTQPKQGGVQGGAKTKFKSAAKSTGKDIRPPHPCDMHHSSVPESERMHWRKDCPNLKRFQEALSNDEVAHKSKHKGKNKKHINIAIGESTMFTCITANLSNSVVFTEATAAALTLSLAPTCLILDTGATACMVSNPDILEGIKPLDQPKVIEGISGNLVIGHSGLLPHIGRVLFNSRAGGINIISSSKVVDNPNLGLEYTKESDTFKLTNLVTGKVFFFGRLNGLYVCDIADPVQAVAAISSGGNDSDSDEDSLSRDEPTDDRHRSSSTEDDESVPDLVDPSSDSDDDEEDNLILDSGATISNFRGRRVTVSRGHVLDDEYSDSSSTSSGYSSSSDSEFPPDDTDDESPLVQVLNQVTRSQLEQMYTKRDLARMESVRELSKRLSFPSTADLVEIVRRGVDNSDVNVADVYRAARILGPDLQVVKGKATKRKLKPIRPEPTLKLALTEQTLYSDIMHVLKIPFLISVSQPLGLTLATHLPNKGTASLIGGFKQQFAAMAGQGFKVKSVAFDEESAIGPAGDSIRAMGAQIEQVPHGTHVEVVERKQRVIKERCRCVIHGLFFNLPKVLVVMLVLYCVSRINMMPSRLLENGLSPRENFLGRKLSSKDICLGFGDYVLIHEERQFTNGMEPRAQEAICVLPLGNLSGACKFFTLKTHRFVTRANWTAQTVIPDWVRENLNALAAADDAPVGPLPVFEVERNGVPVPVPDGGDPVAPPAPPLPIPEHHIVERREDPTELQAVAEPVSADPSSEEPLPSSAVSPDPDFSTTVQSDHGGAADEVTRRYPSRENRTFYKDRTFVADDKIFHISVTKALKDHGAKASSSMHDELKQLLDKDVIDPKDPKSLTKEQLEKIIPSHMFLKEKFLSTGEFEKLKSRLVAGGHKQDKTLYDDVSSPTVSTSAAFMIAAIAAAENRCVATVDITGAYLNASMPADSEVLMRLDPTMSEIIVGIRPEYKKLLNHKGCLIVRLKKALYGCIESAKLWYEELSSTMEKIGFVRNPSDLCVFNRMYKDTQCTACLHVDDLKITCADPDGIEDTIEQLTKKYKTLTVHRGLIHSYLGMTFDYSVEGKVKITMEKYVSDMLAEYAVTGSASTPATTQLFEIDKDLSEKFHSRVAKILYLSKRARPDTLTAVAFLSTRVTAPTKQDWHKLERLLKYIRSTAAFGIVLEAHKDICVIVWTDASYGVHADGKSHTGMCVSLGRGAVYVRSGKQKIVSKSSTESELISLSDSVPQAVWSRDFLSNQGYKIDPALIYQDNKSTIALAEKGRSTSDRTRHINIRYFFVKDRIDQGEIKVQYLPTEDMIADILTKPLQGVLFRKLRKQLLNWEE
jgi:hypothetical protein